MMPFVFMPYPPNQLRYYRKLSPLKLSDVAKLMGLSDYSNLSRSEKGERPISSEQLIIYQLLFDASLKQLFQLQYLDVRKKLMERIRKYLVELLNQPHSLKNEERILYLNCILDSLTQIQTYEEQ